MENDNKDNPLEELENMEILKFSEIIAILRVSAETVRRYIKRDFNPLPAHYLSADKKRTPRNYTPTS